MRRPLKNISKTSSNISRTKAKVFAGLSGGVDSAVSATLLKKEGYDVTGVFIRAWQPDWLPCTWREERRDAMKVALTLDIPFLFIDAEKEYKEAVVDTMLAEYRANRTPNPDVLCNREIKFGIFWQKAKALGADYIATGHYARVHAEVRPLHLVEGRDGGKDQSYFLWTLTQDDLAHTLFPVGHLEKSEVRKLAKKFKLPVAEKKDSQGICFMGDVSMDDFLAHYIESKPGDVCDPEGARIGTHKGLVHYTVGERHGFEITKKEVASGPFYVIGKDVEKNRLIVSDKREEITEHSPKKIALKNLNWINEPQDRVTTARIRYRGEKLPVEIEGETITFAEPVRGLSLGQSIVF